MVRPNRVDALTLVTAQKRVLELVVDGAPLADVLRQLTQTVESMAGGCAVASIMLLDDEGRLRNAAAPSLPDDYLAAIDGLPADPCLGTCCAAAATAQTVITPDFSTAPGWKGIAHLPLALGLMGAWSQPIMARDGRVLGTFGTYFREVREPTPVEREVVEVLARTAAIAIDRERADADLRRARDEAERASRTKSEFMAVMSHELRTPLAGIIGYADLLANGVGGPLADPHRQQVERIKAGAWHLAAIIDEILSFSRLEAGQEEVDLEDVDLGHVLRDAADLLSPQAAARGLSLTVQQTNRTILRSDAGKIRQILLNLGGNAIKYGGEGPVEMTVSVERNQITIRVTDSGPGIPAADHERVFDPFVRLRTDRPGRGGTGLGLSVSRNLARLLGGDVVLERSAPGQGSTFALQLPYSQPARGAAPPPAAHAAG